MKYILLLLLTVTLAFSAEKKIILGTYIKAKHSVATLEKVNKIIEKDKSLKIFMDLNHLSVQVDKIGQYDVVSIKTFTSYRALLHVMSKLKKYYSDLYVLPPYKDIIKHPKAIKHVVVAKPQEIVKPVVVDKPIVLKEQKKPVQSIQKTQEIVKKEKKQEIVKPAVAIKKPEEKAFKEKKSEILNEDNLIREDELTETSDQENLINYQIAITIIIAIILFMILINTIIKLRRSSKKEKYTPFKDK